MFGEIPDLGWPPLHDDSLPDSLTVLDAVEFFARHVSKPTSQYDRFDRERGLLEYADHVNRLFRRNQHPFFLDESGIVKRQLPETLQPIVVQDLRSPDQEVNRLLDAAILKLQDKDLEVRREALEKLWDAWERLKTVLAPDKKTGAERLLEQAIPSEALRNEISAEAKTLTKIGNDFRIRHSETTKYPVERSIDVDYLFHRMYSLLRIFIRGLED
jgi:hypothetical protein